MMPRRPSFPYPDALDHATLRCTSEQFFLDRERLRCVFPASFLELFAASLTRLGSRTWQDDAVCRARAQGNALEGLDTRSGWAYNGQYVDRLSIISSGRDARAGTGALPEVEKE